MLQSLAVPPGVTGPGSLRYFAEERNLPSDPAEAERIYLDRLLAPKIASTWSTCDTARVRYQLELMARTVARHRGGHAVSSRAARRGRQIRRPSILAEWAR